MSDFPCPCGGACVCHSSPGAYPAPCNIPGGCGSTTASAVEAQRCRRGPRCSSADEVDDVLVGAITDRALCRACTDDVDSALRDAPMLYVQLRQRTIDAGSTGSDERVTRSKAQPLPLNASALDLTDQLHWLTTTWADEVIRAADRPAPDRTSQPEAQQIADAAFLLRTYRRVWTEHPVVEINVTRTTAVTQAGWESASLLIDWKRTARRRLGVAGLTHRPPEPCPACNVPGVLERRDGDDKVRCTNCGKAWTLKMYETFVHAWMGAAPSPTSSDAAQLGRRLGPPSDAAGQDARRGSAAHAWGGAA